MYLSSLTCRRSRGINQLKTPLKTYLQTPGRRKVAITRMTSAAPLVLFLCLLSCGSTPVERIPNTSRLDATVRLSVSPDNRWLVFWETTTSPREEPELDGVRVSCIDLQTNKKVRLEVADGVGTGDLAWGDLARGYDYDGWIGDKLYIRYPKWVELDPVAATLKPAHPPRGNRTCSDCPPRERFRRHVMRVFNTRYVTYEHYDEITSSWVGGVFSDTTYTATGSSIDIVDPEGKRFKLLSHTSLTKQLSVHCVRVSPDGRYFAYSVHGKLKLPMPSPDRSAEVYLLDVESGERRKVWSCGYVSNLVWSADGRTLYFGSEGWRNSVCRLNVQRVFKNE